MSRYLYRGRHRATRYRLTVADIREALYREQDWNHALYVGPVSPGAIDAYLKQAA